MAVAANFYLEMVDGEKLGACYPMLLLSRNPACNDVILLACGFPFD